MDNEGSDEHHRGTARASSQIEISEAALSGETKPNNLDMFAHPISLDSLPSSEVQRQETNRSREGWERSGARPRDSQRQYSLPGPPTSSLLPPQRSDTLACDSQNGAILEDDHGPKDTKIELPLARPLPFPLPQHDGLADNFIAKHSSDDTILQNLHKGTQMQQCSNAAEVSEGLEVNFLAKHSQDDSILEDLYKDDDTQVQPPLAAPQPWPSQQHFNSPEISGETLHAGLCGNGDISTQGVTALQAERDAGSVGNALNVDSTQVAVAEEQPAAETCEHYKRKCFAWFPCCEQFWPCHQCHNFSRECGEAAASNSTHLKCSKCDFVQEIENGPTCQNCQIKMAAYFCRICKLLSNVHVDKEPYHCEKCGVCRSYRTKSFHCDICGLCMNVLFKDNHKCRPSSAHDECCICLEDIFSGCQVLPCSHKVHRKCYVKMLVWSNLDTCPICRQSISRSQRR